MKKLYLACAAGIFLISGTAMAQTDLTATIAPETIVASTAPAPAPTRNNGDQPIEITASKSVEWQRNDQKYIARENVVITQGAVTINSDLAVADYRDSAKSSMEIWQMTAEGNVTIVSDGNTATGSKAVYDVDSAVATLTGDNLKLISPDQVVTATERMEYHPNTRQAKAIGNAKVLRGEDTLSANSITAIFKDNSAAKPDSTGSPAGTGNLERIDAVGNVVIVTPTETLRGARSVYNAATNTADLSGNVKIERGKNILEGEKATVNLTTNVSTMYAGAGKDGRVTGRFYPGSDKKAGNAPKTAVPAPSNPNPPVAAPINPATVTP